MFRYIEWFHVCHTEQIHVENSIENVEQALLKFRYDIQIYRYYGEKVAENEIALIPKATEFMGGNSYMPNVKCSLAYRETGTDIILLFELRKGVEIVMFITHGIFLLIIMCIAIQEPSAIIPFSIIGIGRLLWDRNFSYQRIRSLAQRIIKKIMEVLKENTDDRE